MGIKQIQTEAEYMAALKEVERLFQADNDTLEPEQMEILFDFIEAYEDRYYSIPQPTLTAKILYFLESRGFLHQ